MKMCVSLVCMRVPNLRFNHEDLACISMFHSPSHPERILELTSWRDLSSMSAFFFCAMCRPRKTCLPIGRRSRAIDVLLEDSGWDSTWGSLVASSSASAFLFLDFFLFFDSDIEDESSLSSASACDFFEDFDLDLDLDLDLVFDLEDFRFGSGDSLADEVASSLPLPSPDSEWAFGWRSWVSKSGNASRFS